MIMKNTLKIVSLAILILTAMSSCDLNKYPFDSIEQSQSFQTIKDATTLDNGLYGNLRSRVYGIYAYTTDVQADQLNATLDYGNRNGFPHQWTNFLATDYNIRDMWSGYYNALINVNNFLNNVDKIPLTTPSDTALVKNTGLVKQYKGEAYLMRAFYHHQLVLRWAKAYDPTTAATDPGVPVMLAFDLTAKPMRSTVADTYKQILADIAQAKTLLAAVPGAQSSIKLTRDCVLALEARVALCMQNWTLATTSANALITSGAYPLVNTAAAMKSMWLNDVSSEVIFQMFVSNPNELANINSIYLGFSSAKNWYIPDFVPEQWVIDLYSDLDIRKAVYLDKKLLYIQGAQYPNIYCINKFYGNPALYTAPQTNYEQKPKVFRVAEMYLISAEAAAHSPATEAAALTTLNLLRVSRGIPALTGLSGTALMTAIQDERTREMLCEGTRLDDLKRWKMGFTRSTPQNMNIINTGADFNLKTVSANDPKFVWGIPSNDLTTNPNIGQANQNPGW
jgi:hypothetical protein